MGKQKINRLLILLLVALLIGGCTKSKQDTTIEFVIRNPANGKPFAGVPVKIMEREAKNSGVDSKQIFQGETNMNGRISYTFKAKKTGKYWYIPIIDESYFGGTYGVDWSYLARPAINWNPIKKDQYNEALYEIVFYAYLKEKIKNVNCEGNTDTLFMHNWSQIIGGSRSFDQNYIRTGCYYYETPLSVNNGYAMVFMGKVYYDYEVHRPSGIIYGKDSVYIDAGEMKTFELQY